MRTKTGWESFVGIFTKGKSESLRQERLRDATIDDKLQDLIAKSDVIVKLLQGQLEMLNVQKTKVEGNLAGTLTDRETTVEALEAVRKESAAMDPALIELENKISVAMDAAARTKLETELATLDAKHNALVQDEQVKLARSQTLERYIEKGKTWVDSLTNQVATQLVLINKLQTDTKQQLRRLAEVIALQQRITTEIMQTQLGRRERVLIEGPAKRGDQWMARTAGFKTVIIPRDGLNPGDFCEVDIDRPTSATLFGRVV